MLRLRPWSGSDRAIDEDVRWPRWQEVHEAAGEASSSVTAACPAVGGDVMNVRGFASALAASPKEADEEEAICGAKGGGGGALC